MSQIEALKLVGVAGFEKPLRSRRQTVESSSDPKEGRPDTERLVEEVRKLKDRPDTERLIEEIRKLNIWKRSG